MDEIEGWRKKIDEIDLKLVELLNQRSQCAIEIGKIKKKLEIDIYDPRREETVIEGVRKASTGPLTKEAVQRLFERIVDESRRAQREVKNSEESNQTDQRIKES
jgi:monofunctional chorismate mutase